MVPASSWLLFPKIESYIHSTGLSFDTRTPPACCIYSKGSRNRPPDWESLSCLTWVGITERPVESLIKAERPLVSNTEALAEHPFRTVCPDTVSWKVSEHPSACSYRPLAEVTEHSQCSTRSEHSQCSTQSEHLLMVPVSLRLLFPKIESYLLSAGYPEGSLRCLGLL